MRYVRILLLYFEEVFEYRSRVLVWFLIGFINSLIYFVFWKGSLTGSGSVASPVSISDITSYYFFLIIAGAFLVVHIEEDVAYWDIQQGGLVKYLMKPFSYFRIKFLQELPWRVSQGLIGVFAFLLLVLAFGRFFRITQDPYIIMLAIISTLLALGMSFTFKMIVGILTIWITDYSGLHQLVTVVFFIFAGFVIPLDYLPEILHKIAMVLPFGYMIYYPIRAFQGLLSEHELYSVIGIQAIWLFLLLGGYAFFWRKGIKEFTGVGQ